MDIGFCKDIVEGAPAGCVLLRAVTEGMGAPPDLEILYANPEFAGLTGLAASSLAGRRLSVALPGLLESDFDWVCVCCRVLQTGEPYSGRMHSGFFKRGFHVWAFSPEPSCVASFFFDTPDESDENQDSAGLDRITGCAEWFLQMTPETMNYRHIAEAARFFSGAVYVAFHLQNRFSQAYTMVDVAGCEEENGCGSALAIRLVLGSRRSGEERGGDAVREPEVYQDLASYVGEALPQLKDSPALGGIGQVAVCPLRRGEQLFGDFTILMPEGKPFIRGKMLDLYIRLVVLMLNKLDMEQTLREGLRRSEKLVELLREPFGDMSEFLGRALSLAIESSGSRYGYIFLYDEDTQLLTLYAWLPEETQICGENNRRPVYSLQSVGLCGEAVKQRRSVIVNDYTADNPLKRGSPEAQVDIRRFLSVPVIEKDRIVAVVGLANKRSEYDERDSMLLTLLMNNVWSVVQRQRSDTLLHQEKEMLRTTLLSIGDGILATDGEGRVTVINEAAQRLCGWSQQDAVGRPFQEVFHVVEERSKKRCPDPVRRVLESGKPQNDPKWAVLVSSKGRRRYISHSASPIVDKEGMIRGVVLAFRDVTAEKHRIEEVEYLSFHDRLTGLYNRAFFEEEVKRLDVPRNLPLSIIMSDVNGLKLANDAFGHDMGDELLKKAAQVLKSCCRRDDIVSRIGGDEFVFLLPRTGQEDAEKLVARIRNLCSTTKVGSVGLSISFGLHTKKEKDESFREVLKRAEDQMYRHKLFEGPGLRSRTIETIAHTLYETQPKEEGHAARVSELCEAIGRAMGLSERDLGELVSAGLLHDIGKISVSSRLFEKAGPLSEPEWQEVRRHPEIGYRILGSVKDLTEVAECVLAHHEHWDGSGYPKGLKGRQIPLCARIVSLADAFDAMTDARPFRPAMQWRKAMEEIRRESGRQFDPEVAEVFLSLYDR